MSVAREVVIFANRAGLKLFGVLHHPPPETRADVAVLLLSPGVKMRVGPERLYCTMARHFADLGFPVLRFDFFGLGDSEGEVTEELLKDVYNHIEVGRFVDDTLSAMDWMAREHGIRRFILSGLCGGAITGLLAAQRDPRVAGLLALAITPVLASRSAQPGMYMTAGQAVDLQRSYLRKLISPKAWLRLLLLRTDYRFMWRAMTHRWRASSERRRTPIATGKVGPAANTPDETDDANPLFPPAFFAMIESGRPILLVFGGSDRLLWEYAEKFADRHRERLERSPGMHEVHTIAQANHVLSFEPWQREMLAVSTNWLRRRFPVNGQSGSP